MNGLSLKQALWVWFFVLLTLKILAFVPAVHPLVLEVTYAAHVLILMGTTFYWASRETLVWQAISFDSKSILSGVIWGLSASFLLLVSVVILGMVIGNRLPFGIQVDLNLSGFTGFAFLNQIVLVAIPEEMFFRGFLQTSFEKHWPASKKILGVPFGRAIFCSSLIFAFSHSIIQFQIWHVLIVIPSLAFAWLTTRTKTVWAAAIFHATCNLIGYSVRFF